METNRKIDIESLVDIKDVVINAELPRDEKIKSYVEQIKNPYCYRDGDMIIQISFKDNETSLDERLKAYILSCVAL